MFSTEIISISSLIQNHQHHGDKIIIIVIILSPGASQ